jgi:predicted DNA-binding transcriptional regulator AlpA
MAAAPALVRIVRSRELTQHLKVSKGQLLRLRKLDPSFPVPFRLGTGRNGEIAWYASEIDAWLENRPRAVLPATEQSRIG